MERVKTVKRKTERLKKDEEIKEDKEKGIQSVEKGKGNKGWRYIKKPI